MTAHRARPLPYPSRLGFAEREVAVGIAAMVLLVVAMVAWGAVTLFG